MPKVIDPGGGRFSAGFLSRTSLAFAARALSLMGLDSITRVPYWCQVLGMEILMAFIILALLGVAVNDLRAWKGDMNPEE